MFSRGLGRGFGFGFFVGLVVSSVFCRLSFVVKSGLRGYVFTGFVWFIVRFYRVIGFVVKVFFFYGGLFFNCFFGFCKLRDEFFN